MIKISKTKDSKLLAELNREVQELHHTLYPTEFKAFNQSEIETDLQAIISKENTTAFIAWHGKIAVAYMICMLKTKEESAFQFSNQYLLIDQIAVLSSFRRMGIAKRLIHEANSYAESINASRIHIQVWKKNKTARKFFKKYGFNVEQNHFSRSIT
jgi:ribosomal protein S18 acetylase RimI-like enzyme